MNIQEAIVLADKANYFHQYFNIKLPSRTYVDFAKTLCEKYGFKSCHNDDSYWDFLDYPAYFVVYYKKNEYHFNRLNDIDNKYIVLEFDQLEELLIELNNREKDIFVIDRVTNGEEEVIFNENSVIIGDYQLTRTVVKLIYDRLMKTEEKNPCKYH